MFLFPYEEAAESLGVCTWPSDRYGVATPHIRPTSTAFCKIQGSIDYSIYSCWECFTTDEQERIHHMIEDVVKDDAAAEQGAHSHGLRRDQRRNGSHVALSMEDFKPVVR